MKRWPCLNSWFALKFAVFPVVKYTMADRSVTTEFFYTLLLIFFCFFCILRCKKHEVPVEKVYNKTQREKFAWALDMAEKDFVFWSRLVSEHSWHSNHSILAHTRLHLSRYSLQFNLIILLLLLYIQYSGNDFWDFSGGWEKYKKNASNGNRNLKSGTISKFHLYISIS